MIKLHKLDHITDEPPDYMIVQERPGYAPPLPSLLLDKDELLELAEAIYNLVGNG